MASTGVRRFAPISKQNASSTASDAPKLKGIVFDMDGTLCEPQTYMFGEMRAALGIPKSIDILAHIESLPPTEQPEAIESIRAIERRAMQSQAPSPGLAELMTYLDANDIPKAICTRNFDVPVRNLVDKFLTGCAPFEPIITRDFKPPKPHPAGILHIATNWGLQSSRSSADGEIREQEPPVGNGEEEKPDASCLIMVGDSIDDMTAGRMAGAATVLLLNDVNAELATHEHTDLTIRRLDDLIKVLEEGFQGREIRSS